ncbi:hypothetical protein DFQ27_006252 [Actinomortierella ambigua]|uniref:Transmembrane protein n=1 Tax=Actinomortierella ambigua TaxID=1343610 RepID=A0A9P6UC63_9FUNG|nr:hypothetical protein DFQ27_006252 [Actinomortierella ambigua]
MPPPEKTIASPQPTPTSVNTQIITFTYNGSTTVIPAYQTANHTMFPHVTTRAPVTTVIGSWPPPPIDASAPPSMNSDANNGIVWRNWGLVSLSVIIVGLLAYIGVRKYRSGRTKKQEPTGDFMSVGEDDDLHRSPLPGGSVISLATLGGGSGGQGTGSATTAASTVRERRNSVGVQPLPRAMDRKSRP